VDCPCAARTGGAAAPAAYDGAGRRGRSVPAPGRRARPAGAIRRSRAGRRRRLDRHHDPFRCGAAKPSLRRGAISLAGPHFGRAAALSVRALDHVAAAVAGAAADRRRCRRRQDHRGGDDRARAARSRASAAPRRALSGTSLRSVGAGAAREVRHRDRVGAALTDAPASISSNRARNRVRSATVFSPPPPTS
jgi:hypothetical protein